MIIIHRVNTIEKLKNIPQEYGVEIDVRGFGRRLLLNHDPIDDPEKHEDLEDFLYEFRHRLIIFNLKEAGYEKRIIRMAEDKDIDYFLLDVEFPYLYRATRKDNFRKIAVRYSEAEPIESVEAQARDGRALLDWVWVDTNTMLPLDRTIITRFRKLGLKSCIVCPERWGRPQDISTYIGQMKKLGYRPDAVMTSLEHAQTWKEFICDP